MAKIKVLGDAVQLISALKTEDIARVEMLDKGLLTLVDDEGNEVFKISLGSASVSKYGITFANTNPEGYAYVTSTNIVEDHTNPEEEKRTLARYYSPIISKLSILEEEVENALTTLNEKEAELLDSIEIM